MISKYYSKVEFLPAPDPKYIINIQEIKSQSNICPTANIDTHKENIFSIYEVSDELQELYQSYFDYKIYVRWQVATDALPIHYDWGTSVDKYLYLIDAGGDNVNTEFWSTLPGDIDIVDGGSTTVDDRTLLYSIHETENNWFKINVKAPHRVVNITRPRIALIIRPDGLTSWE